MATNKESSDHHSFKRTILQFGETTSIKGVSRGLKTNRGCLRVMWFVAVLLGGSIALSQIISLIIDFLAYKTTTNFSENYDVDPEFPDITFCHLNPLAAVNINNVRAFFGAVDEIVESDSHVISEKTGLTEAEIEMAITQIGSLSTFFQNLNATNDTMRDFILSCDWTTWDLKTSKHSKCLASLIPVYSPHYLQCFKLKVPPKVEDVRGVSLIFFLNDTSLFEFAHYSNSISYSKASGVRVMVHPRDTLPDPMEGLTASPGHETTVVLGQKRRTLLPDPYGNCQNRAYLNQSATNETYEYRYTKAACDGVCYQKQVIKNCNCITALQPYTKKQRSHAAFCGKLNKLIKFSNPIDQSQYMYTDYDNYYYDYDDYSDYEDLPPLMNITMEDILDLVVKTVCTMKTEFRPDCDCPIPCESQRYTLRISQAPWPHPSYIPAFVEKFVRNSNIKEYIFPDKCDDDAVDYEEENFLPPSHSGEEPQEKEVKCTNAYLKDTHMLNEEGIKEFEKNFLQVNVYFGERLLTNIEEVATLSITTMLATVGGALNLWIGITFMTFIELFELVFNILLLMKSPKRVDIEESKSQEKEQSLTPVTAFGGFK